MKHLGKSERENGARTGSDWFSYDLIAAQYGSAAEPLYFAEPARDLVSLLRLEAGETLLDIGSGSGAVAAAAMRANPGVAVVASDRSVSMLATARVRHAITRAVAGELPHLPFRAGTFDAASLGFVLSHVRDLDAALREVARALVTGGRIASSSWLRSGGESDAGVLWLAVARQYCDGPTLDAAVEDVLPWEERLTQSRVLVDALTAAGFTQVRSEERAYRNKVSTSAFQQSRVISAAARFLRARLDEDAWDRFVAHAANELAREFGPEVVVETSVSFVTAWIE